MPECLTPTKCFLPALLLPVLSSRTDSLFSPHHIISWPSIHIQAIYGLSIIYSVVLTTAIHSNCQPLITHNNSFPVSHPPNTLINSAPLSANRGFQNVKFKCIFIHYLILQISVPVKWQKKVANRVHNPRNRCLRYVPLNTKRGIPCHPDRNSPRWRESLYFRRLAGSVMVFLSSKPHFPRGRSEGRDRPESRALSSSRDTQSPRDRAPWS